MLSNSLSNYQVVSNKKLQINAVRMCAPYELFLPKNKCSYINLGSCLNTGYVNVFYRESPLYIGVSIYCCVPGYFVPLILLPIDFSSYYIQDSLEVCIYSVPI